MPKFYDLLKENKELKDKINRYKEQYKYFLEEIISELECLAPEPYESHVSWEGCIKPIIEKFKNLRVD